MGWRSVFGLPEPPEPSTSEEEKAATQEQEDIEGGTVSTVPWQAYIPNNDAETLVEGNSGDNTEEEIDTYLGLPNNYLFQTELYHFSDVYSPTGETIKARYDKLINEGSFKHHLTYSSTHPLADRYIWGVDPASAPGGSGGPASLPVDFKYSPFVEPSLLNETFEIEAVLRAGFLPGFRPGEDAIISHPDRYATMRVMSIDKEVIYATTNFMMEGYNKATKESFKIIESTLGNTLQLNNEKFKLFKMKLGLVDAQEPFDWLRSWEDKWEKYMRASVLARNRWRWYILFGSHLIGGYPLQYSLGADAKDEPFAGIVVDVFVTDEVLLPEMKRMTSEAGLPYFKWGGTTYNANTMQFDKTIPEYPSIPSKATSPDEAEFENEP